MISSSPNKYKEPDTPKHTICTKIGENGETVTVSFNTEESHEATQSGTHKHALYINSFHRSQGWTHSYLMKVFQSNRKMIDRKTINKWKMFHQIKMQSPIISQYKIYKKHTFGTKQI